MIALKRTPGHALIEKLQKKRALRAKIDVVLVPVSSPAFNVVGRLVAEPTGKSNTLSASYVIVWPAGIHIVRNFTA